MQLNFRLCSTVLLKAFCSTVTMLDLTGTQYRIATPCKNAAGCRGILSALLYPLHSATILRAQSMHLMRD